MSTNTNATYPHKWWAIAICFVLSVVAGLGSVALLLGLHAAALAVVAGGFATFVGGLNATLAVAKAAGLVH